MGYKEGKPFFSLGDRVMLWIIAIVGCLIGSLGMAMALGARLRIASLEQELAHCRRMGALQALGDRRVGIRSKVGLGSFDSRWSSAAESDMVSQQLSAS